MENSRQQETDKAGLLQKEIKEASNKVQVSWMCKCNITIIRISNNQRLRSLSDYDRRSKHFCFIAVLCISFTWQIVETHVIRLQVTGGPNALDQIAFCAFHLFSVKSKWMLATYMQQTSNNNLDIRIVGSSCRPRQYCIVRWCRQTMVNSTFALRL